jgi:membrane fusion protein (multidrug efflux system)
VSSYASCLSAAGRVSALVTALLAGVLLSSCNRDKATPTDGKAAAAATPPGGAAPSGATPATKAAPNAAPNAATPPPGQNPAMAAKRAGDAEKEKARQAAAEMVPVETALVTRGAISAFLSFNATLETESVVDIYPQTSGQVETLLVEEGKVVKEGDPLLKIEDRELRVDVEENTGNFEHLKKNFARTEDLYQRNLVNKQDYETQHYQLEQARLKLERAKIRLEYATVRAPFDGVISARETQVGARVGSGTKLFSMVKLDDLVARIFVPGRYLPVVAEKQESVVTSEFLPDRTFKGWVKRISPVIDPKSGTFKVTVGVKGDKPTDLPPGLFVGVRVITDTRPNAVLIPKRAVVYEGGERYVFTVVKDRAVKKKLAVGFEDPNNVEATSGFEVGTPVIVLGQSGLKDGALVRSVNATPAASPAAAPVAKPEDAKMPPPAPKKTASAEAPKAEKS